eukprot:m.941136 g.941136  ORF g.941136 m.941136 type:complete len:61 (-) comp23832_c0_seq1:3901-4083(-)
MDPYILDKELVMFSSHYEQMKENLLRCSSLRHFLFLTLPYGAIRARQLNAVLLRMVWVVL